MTKDLTLISTFFAEGPIMPAIRRLMPERVILIASDVEPIKKKEFEDALGRVREQLALLQIELEIEHTAQFDVRLTVQKTAAIIEREYTRGRRVIADITGGRKTMSIGLLFACFSRHGMVESVIYSPENGEKHIELPLLSFEMTKDRQRILSALQANKSVVSVSAELGKSRAYVYQQLLRLKKDGYVRKTAERFVVTDAGKIASLVAPNTKVVKDAETMEDVTDFEKLEIPMQKSSIKIYNKKKN